MSYSSSGPSYSGGDVIAPATHGDNELALWNGVNSDTLQSTPNARLNPVTGDLSLSGAATSAGLVLVTAASAPSSDAAGFVQLYSKTTDPAKLILRTSDGIEHLVGEGVTDHTALTNLQGGQAGEYYHLTSSEHIALLAGSGHGSLSVDQHGDVTKSGAVPGYGLIFDGGLNLVPGPMGGVVPDATTTVKGIVELATDGETLAGVVVQGNDARLSDPRTPASHGLTFHTSGAELAGRVVEADGSGGMRFGDKTKPIPDGLSFGMGMWSHVGSTLNAVSLGQFSTNDPIPSAVTVLKLSGQSVYGLGSYSLIRDLKLGDRLFFSSPKSVIVAGTPSTRQYIVTGVPDDSAVTGSFIIPVINESGNGDTFDTIPYGLTILRKEDTHSALTTNPHAVTKLQLALENVDNVADADKVVSAPQQDALNLKADLADPRFLLPDEKAGIAAAASPVTALNPVLTLADGAGAGHGTTISIDAHGDVDITTTPVVDGDELIWRIDKFVPEPKLTGTGDVSSLLAIPVDEIVTGDNGAKGVKGSGIDIGAIAAAQGTASTALTTANLALPAIDRGAPDGVASLDGTGKILPSELPSTVLKLIGPWEALTNTPDLTLPAYAGVAGDTYTVSIAGTQDLGDVNGSRTFSVSDRVMYTGASWVHEKNTDSVGTDGDQFVLDHPALGHANTPSDAEKAALAGTGIPDVSNPYVSDDDGRLVDARAPLPHALELHTSGTELSGRIVQADGSGGLIWGNKTAGTGGQTNTVTAINGLTKTGDNVDVILEPSYGSLPGTVAQGNDARFPTNNQNSALAGTAGPPDVNNRYVVNDDTRLTDPRTPTIHSLGSVTEHTGTSLSLLNDLIGDRNLLADADKLDLLTVINALDLDALASDVGASKAKTDLITIINPVNLDTLASDVANAIPISARGQADGVASLDVTGKLPSTQLPLSVLEFKGGWDASLNSPSLSIPYNGVAGDTYTVTTIGTVDLLDGAGARTFALTDRLLYDATNTAWIHEKNADEVGASGDSFAGTHPADGHTNTPFADEKAALVGTGIPNAGNPYATEDTVTAVQAGAVSTGQVGAPGGIATLDGTAVLTAAQIPTTVLKLVGPWDALTNTPDIALPAYAGVSGDTYTVSIAGAQDLGDGSGSRSFLVTDRVVYTGSTWVHEKNTDSVGTDGDQFAADHPALGHTNKAPVRAATTAQRPFTTGFANGQVFDGVTLVTGDRILLKDQTDGIENGIYTVNATGAPSRAADYATGATVGGTSVFVQEGTLSGDRGYLCTNNGGADVVNTAALVFELAPRTLQDVLASVPIDNAVTLDTVGGNRIVLQDNGPIDTVDSPASCLKIKAVGYETHIPIEGNPASGTLTHPDYQPPAPLEIDCVSLSTPGLAVYSSAMLPGSRFEIHARGIRSVGTFGPMDIFGAWSHLANGGGVDFRAGGSTATSGNGGVMSIFAGVAQGDSISQSGTGGKTEISGGNSKFGQGGSVHIFGASGVTTELDGDVVLHGRELKFAHGIAIQETAVAPVLDTADTSVRGRLWVKDTTPTSLIYTDETGTDLDLSTAYSQVQHELASTVHTATGRVEGDYAAADGTGAVSWVKGRPAPNMALGYWSHEGGSGAPSTFGKFTTDSSLSISATSTVRIHGTNSLFTGSLYQVIQDAGPSTYITIASVNDPYGSFGFYKVIGVNSTTSTDILLTLSVAGSSGVSWVVGDAYSVDIIGIGSLAVTDGTTSITGVDTIGFQSGTVTAGAAGVALYSPPAGSAGAPSVTEQYVGSFVNVRTDYLGDLIPGLSITPAAGTYLVSFCGGGKCDQLNTVWQIKINVDGTPATNASWDYSNATATDIGGFSGHTLVTVVGGQVIQLSCAKISNVGSLTLSNIHMTEMLVQ